MPNNIGFRVTGMYLGASDSVTGEIRVDIDKDNPTVYDVMVAVVHKVKNGDVPGVSEFSFTPTFPRPKDGLDSITVNYTQPPKTQYSPGTYFLADTESGNPAQVFQYYIFDKDFKQKNNNGVSKRFNEAPDKPIVEGDTIVWRQLSILQGPIESPRVKRRLAREFAALTSA